MQLQFNIYGLIVGIALVVGSSLMEKQFKKNTVLVSLYYKVVFFSFIFSVLGARVWHVFTDFHLYSNNLPAVFAVTNGGLSIFGGIIGAVLGLVIALAVLPELRDTSVAKKKLVFLQLLDYSIFGLPVAQAIGRWGNYFNQELYGAPTTGFFKIFIDPEYRLAEYSQVAYYHPLFFYEMLATTVFAIVLYVFRYKASFLSKFSTIQKLKLLKIGTGNLFLAYILYYSIVRFFLDFLRIDTAILFFNTLGINQVVLLVVITILATYFITHIIRLQGKKHA